MPERRCPHQNLLERVPRGTRAPSAHWIPAPYDEQSNRREAEIGFTHPNAPYEDVPVRPPGRKELPIGTPLNVPDFIIVLRKHISSNTGKVGSSTIVVS